MKDYRRIAEVMAQVCHIIEETPDIEVKQLVGSTVGFDVETGEPVCACTAVEWVGEMSEDQVYYSISDWSNGMTTIDASEEDAAIVLTPELKKALLRRLLKEVADGTLQQ